MFQVILAVLLVGVVIFGIYQKLTNGVCYSKARLPGKVAIVTGGTAGMGLEIALDLAKREAKVIIASPFPKEGEEALEKIFKESGNKQVTFELLDLASLKSTREFAKKILETEERLDILVNNAGVGVVGDFMTDDGLNFIMQVNYFGHFLLTMLLLPLLKKSVPSRIVNQSSALHRLGSVDIGHLNSKGYWNTLQLYNNSKLCLILFAKELTKRLKSVDIMINCTDPGAVGTRIFDTIGSTFLGGICTYVNSILCKTPRQGAQTAIYLCTDESVKVSGELFKDCQLSIAHNKHAFDDQLAKKLWDETKKLVRLDDNEMIL